MENQRSKVVIGVSGGVDSTASLILLKERGFEPIGVFLRFSFWKDSKNKIKGNVHSSDSSYKRAKEVCRKLKVPFYAIDCSEDFDKNVIGYFLSTLKKSQTPSPCLICNRLVKFNTLLKFANKTGAQFIATGHYAKVRKSKKTGKFELLKPKDKEKDQTYFLAYLSQGILKKTIFPLENVLKNEVYKVVKKNNIRIFDSVKSSQDLCFVANKSLESFLTKKIGINNGEIRDKDNNILGNHKGFHFYTLGQRKGLNLSNGPWYIINFNKSKNMIYVSKNKSDLLGRKVILKNINFIGGKPDGKILVKAKTRYGQKLSSALLYQKNKKFILEFKKPILNITPGQWSVFYTGNICLGGGICDKILK